ncbi:MAG: FAD-dependent oxidoreductase [Solirubrobacterales bacterium]
MTDTIENVIIIGSGPAGYTAALYTARANLNPLVIEGFAWGGLLQQTTEVENYPGFREGIMGPALMQEMRDQAERFGSRFITDMATKVELADEPGGVHKVWVDEDELHLARTVILAMGAEHKKLGVPGEEELGGRGVSYCATCDAAFFKDAETVIVGGGDSAMEEAIFLSKFAKRVDIVHRRDEFRASKIMLDRARAIDNIVFKTPFVVEAFEAREGDKLPTARLRNVETGAEELLANVGTFIAIGHEPQSSSSPGRSTATTRATSSRRAARRGPTARACSRPATSSTTRTARRSPPPAPAVSPRWTRSGTCATPRRCRRRPGCPTATWPRRSGRPGRLMAAYRR